MKNHYPLVQGIYYLLTGVWPILHISSFMAVTGPKVDVWLVKMVGLLTIAIGAAIIAAYRDKYDSRLLNALAALSYLIIDTYYALTDRISDIYLADAGVELFFLVLIIQTSALKSKSQSVNNMK
jgi:hypothetical protein